MVGLCFDASCFRYNSQYYKQVTGTPMGSPVSVVIAEITMQEIEKAILTTLGTRALFWYRYVDDIISCIPEEDVTNISQEINAVNRHIQFTVEKESDNVINFLDIQLRKSDSGTLGFNVFKKPTHTDKYLSFSSYHPVSHKRSVISSLLNRVENICDDDYKVDEINRIEDALQCNGYTKAIIDSVKRRTIGRQVTSLNNVVSVSPRTSYVKAPYIKGVSEKAARILNRHNVRLAHKPTHTLRGQLCHLKDRRGTNEQTGVVYQFECTECTATYVGETGRLLSERMDEHRKAINNRNTSTKTYQHIALNTDHSFDFDSVKVIDKEERPRIRKILEGIHSVKNPSVINRFRELNALYHPLVLGRPNSN